MYKLKVLYLFIFLGTLALLAFGAMSSLKDDGVISNQGKIKFSHSKHKDIIECADCHSKVKESTNLKESLFPNHDNCASCHEVDNDQQCSTCHIGDNYSALSSADKGLLFSHKSHLLNKDANCESCHKGLSDVDYSWQAPAALPSMETCYGCHNDKSVASNACEGCHISTANLLPQDHKVVSFGKTHKFAAQEFNANCIMCHDNQSCDDCHMSTVGITETNTLKDFYQPYYPANFIDGAKVQGISSVHDLNYRFSHGMDSRGKTAECQSCHQIETFCTECHQAENEDFAMSGIVPSSHLSPNFKTIGVGTGGGEHAILARRDIENCIACHDINGADPTCIQCHNDPDGIKGTNPKTHVSGFMNDGEGGDWHTDNSSICYNCHTSASPQSVAGTGFCGYCHGSKVR